MKMSILLGLVNNAALLLALGLLYDSISIRQKAWQWGREQILTGLVIGGIGIVVMLSPWEYASGLVFDTRSVLLGISGLFFGAVPTLIAMAMTIGLRLYQGGVGAGMGVAVICLSGGLGLGWRHINRRALENLTALQLYSFGVLVHVGMLACAFLLPWPMPLTVLSHIGLAVMLIYPIGTMLLGMLLTRRLRRRRLDEALQVSQERFRALYEYSAAPILEEDFSGVKAYFDNLRTLGVRDFRAYFESHPEAVRDCARLGRVLDANQGAVQFFLARTKEDLLTNLSAYLDVNSWDAFREEMIALAEGQTIFACEITNRTLDGGSKVMILHVSVVPGCEHSLAQVMISFWDITERKQMEQQIKNSLKEKEVLLRELYHRTKNNMQVIRSMLVLQSAGSQEPEVQRLVQEMDVKIEAMALAHQMLYQSRDLSSINLDVYIRDLAQLVASSYRPASDPIALRLDLQAIAVTIDIATPVGLILNELLSNAYKHAFPGGQAGEISIRLRRLSDGMLLLNFSDNGVGVSEGFDLRQQKSYGLQSVFSIAERQLGGRVRVDTHQGIAYVIQFSDALYHTRV